MNNRKSASSTIVYYSAYPLLSFLFPFFFFYSLNNPSAGISNRSGAGLLRFECFRIGVRSTQLMKTFVDTKGICVFYS